MLDNQNTKQIPIKRRRRPQGTGFPAKIFTIVSIIVVLWLGLTDKGPLLPPFPSNFNSFDCHSISFESFKDRAGQIDFKFKTLPSVEYPPEYLPHFLKLTVKTGPTTMRYSGDQIENITRTENMIQFSIDHTWAGDSEITSQCLSNPPQTLKGYLNDIKIHKPQYSTSDDPFRDQAKFHDVCLEFEKFLYFVTIAGDRPAVPFDDTKLRFEMLRWPLDAYLKHKSVSMQQKTCFLVAPIDKKNWKAILLTLIPLSISVSKNEPNANNALFIFRKEVQPEAKNVLNFLSPNEPVKLDNIMCFPTLLMTSTYSKMDANFERINEMLNLDLDPIREKMPKSVMISRKIIICESLFDLLEEELKKKFDCAVYKLSNDMSIQDAAKMVSSANIFIADHIANMIYTIWMSSGQSTLIDATSKDYSCNPWAKKLTQKIGVGYVSINGQEKCQCDNFKCYMTKEPSQAMDVDVNKIISEVKAILNQ
ncbi:hypothetical protein TRFO_32987 [Tritrichomonas foetus]|uniref:Uncharacterized protein n=1 Tax=Tritrichomonas foetus TaxID=1144522 RepID=A0A1J4JSA1_9EUKA|nr:hypothetical protein TRFO_32987 [Tritrichomonas foetus]|eukprot:OHT00390.1 hypothetical protein TRFO_32987 [Tritrichomonas foetus]